MGKGAKRAARRRQEGLEAQAAQDAALARQTQAAQAARIEPGLALLEATKPGEMSPYSQAAYASELRKIIDTWRGVRETGLRTLNQRGFGRAPSGFQGAYQNAADLGQARAETEAYSQGIRGTHDDLLRALSMRMGREQFYDPSSRLNNASNINQGAFNMAAQESSFRDIMSGLGALASIGAAPFTGGASLMGLGGLSAKGGQRGINATGSYYAPVSSTGGYWRM